jgi:hypothetical protein
LWTRAAVPSASVCEAWLGGSEPSMHLKQRQVARARACVRACACGGLSGRTSHADVGIPLLKGDVIYLPGFADCAPETARSCALSTAFACKCVMRPRPPPVVRAAGSDSVLQRSSRRRVPPPPFLFCNQFEHAFRTGVAACRSARTRDSLVYAAPPPPLAGVWDRGVPAAPRTRMM